MIIPPNPSAARAPNDQPANSQTPNGQAPKGLKHWLGFGISGTIAFVVDAGLLKLLLMTTTLPIGGARLLSISCAMVAGWLAHRRFTFNLQTAPTIAEFVRYAGVAWFAAAINYAVFTAILWMRPTLEPTIAVAFSALAAMVVAYLGMRFAAFHPKHTPD
jgi:putative flippase GtrA